MSFPTEQGTDPTARIEEKPQVETNGEKAGKISVPQQSSVGEWIAGALGLGLIGIFVFCLFVLGVAPTAIGLAGFAGLVTTFTFYDFLCGPAHARAESLQTAKMSGATCIASLVVALAWSTISGIWSSTSGPDVGSYAKSELPSLQLPPTVPSTASLPNAAAANYQLPPVGNNPAGGMSVSPIARLSITASDGTAELQQLVAGVNQNEALAIGLSVLLTGADTYAVRVRLTNTGSAPIRIYPENIRVKFDGEVAQAFTAGHALFLQRGVLQPGNTLDGLVMYRARVDVGAAMRLFGWTVSYDDPSIHVTYYR